MSGGGGNNGNSNIEETTLNAGNVMDKMLKLFEPPGGYPGERDAELHPYFKRPGRGHNHDCCDSCREGGALICCDSCPASFHLQCHDPPLEDNDIPEGDWICIKCYASKPETQKKILAETTAASSALTYKKDISELDKLFIPDKHELEGKEKRNKGKKEETVKKDNEWKPKKRKESEREKDRPTRATRLLKQAKYNDNSTEEEFSESEIIDTKQKVRSPKKIIVRKTYLDIYKVHLKLKPRKTCQLFQALLEAANMQNAEEFQLPTNIHVPEKFPYAWKWSAAEQKLRTQRSEDGDTRSKLSLCYVCVKSNRVGVLVQCDFCPCQFHMDCLDPPLAEIPSDVWMCPNHVESFLDSKLTSNRLTERINLWERYATQPIDTHIVKTQFMKKCSRLKRTCSLKATTVASRKRVKVPEFIKLQYNRPVSLLPGPGYDRWVDPTELRAQRLKTKYQKCFTPPQGLELSSEFEEEISQESSEEKSYHDNEESNKTDRTKDTNIQSDVESLSKESTNSATDADEKSSSDIDDMKSVETDENKSEDGKSTHPEIKEEPPLLDDLKKDVPMEVESEVCTTLDKTVDDKSFDQSSIAEKSQFSVSQDHLEWKPKPSIRDAYTQEELEWVSSLVSLQTELLRHKLGVTQDTKPVGTSLECTERLPSQDRFEDLPAGDRSPNSSTVSGISYSGKVAAEHQLMDQLQDYLITHSEVDNLDPVVLKYLAAKQISKILPNRTSLLQSNVRARASLTPVRSRIQPYYMQYRTVEIGTGPSTHLNLRDFGHCNNLSDRHATLFYDELSGHYELINYSEFGTKVDECMYSIDTGIVSLRYKENTHQLNGAVMAAPGAGPTPCYCPPLYQDDECGAGGGSGCEGSALLHHGSLIKFGCLEFVFSVAAIHGL